MKLSRYTLFYKDYPKPGEYLVFNTRTQAIIGINQEVKDFIDKVIHRRPACAKATAGRDTEKNDEEKGIINHLKESGIIIDDDVDESRVLENWFNRIKYQGKSLHATILTTYKCNFACTYCFEERVKQPKSLDEAESNQIIKWLKHQVVKNNLKSLRLMFYGGEPLMNPQAIRQIASDLYPWAKENNIKFSFSITTNGSLVKSASGGSACGGPDLMEELSKIGLRSIRITLDGDKEHHDKRRPYLDGRGTFDAIIANITRMTDKIKIEVGSNFDKENILNLYKLLDYLDEKGLNKRISNMIFSPVIARLGEKKNKRDSMQDCHPELVSGSREILNQVQNDTSSVQHKTMQAKAVGVIPVEMVGCHTLSGELADEALRLRKEVIRRGYKVDKAVVVIACPMEQDHSMVVIDPYGDIYKCAGFVGRNEFSVGNVRTDEFNHRNAEFMTMNPWKKCGDCVYVPMCGGGCRLMAQLKHSDYSKPFCDMEYYQKTFPELLKMDYERGAL